MQAKSYISYAPGKHWSVFALLYEEAGSDVHGWHLEARNQYFSAAFFMLEGFYAAQATRLYRSIQDDVYGPWAIDYPPTGGHIRCPLPDPIGHELERLQSRFVGEWLFFDDEIDTDQEREAYERLGLPIHKVNIRSRRLHRFRQPGSSWVCASPHTDPNIAVLLRKYWRLSEKLGVH